MDHPAKWPYSGYRFHMLGDKNGTIGELLTPLPDVEPDKELAVNNDAIDDEVQMALKDPRCRFVGNWRFTNRMQR